MSWLSTGAHPGKLPEFQGKDCESGQRKYDSRPGCVKWLITIPAEADRVSRRGLMPFTRRHPVRPIPKGTADMGTNSLPDELSEFVSHDIENLRKRLKSFRTLCKKCQSTLQGKSSYGGYGPARCWNEARDVLQQIYVQTGNGNPAILDIVDDELRSGIRRVSELAAKLLKGTFSREVSDYGESAIGLLGMMASQAKDQGLHWLPTSNNEVPGIVHDADDSVDSVDQADKSLKRNGETVESAMMRIFTNKRTSTACISWTQREWAAKLKCTPGRIAQTKTWQAILQERERLKQQRK